MTRLLAGLGSALLGITLLTTAPATAQTARAGTLPDCTEDGPRPCLVSVTRDGAALPDGYALHTRTQTFASGVRLIGLTASHSGQDDLGAADLGSTWSATVDLGDHPGTVVGGKAAGVVVERAGTVVTISGRPVGISGECKRRFTPWRCPEWDDTDFDVRDREAIFRLEISDAADWGWRSEGQRDAATGLTYVSNLAGMERPRLVRDRATRSRYLRIPVGSHRFRMDGTTLVNGRLQVRVPWTLLQRLYRISDPAALAPAGLRVSGAGKGARVTVTPDPATSSVLVDVRRIKFAKGGEVRRIAVRRGS